MYDNDGTANHLLYTAEYHVIGNASEYSGGFGTYVCTSDESSGSWIFATASNHGNVRVEIQECTAQRLKIYGNDSTVGYNSALIRLTTPLPLSGFSELHINYSVNDYGGKAILLGLSDTNDTTNLYTSDAYGTGNYRSLPFGTRTESLAIQNALVDRYLFVKMFNPANSTATWLTINEIWLT